MLTGTKQGFSAFSVFAFRIESPFDEFRTHRHTDTQTRRHTDTDTQTHIHTHTHPDKHTDRHAHKHTDTHKQYGHAVVVTRFPFITKTGLYFRSFLEVPKYAFRLRHSTKMRRREAPISTQIPGHFAETHTQRHTQKNSDFT